MAYQAQYQDTDEYLHDTDMESVANQQQWGVISGVPVTYDAANLTIDIGAGEVVHNGTAVLVSEQLNALTLVADACNERWSYITIDGCGCGVLVSGTAAADACTEPSKPELGCRVPLAFVKIEAAQTVANNISVKLDKRSPFADLADHYTRFFQSRAAYAHVGLGGDSNPVTTEQIGDGWQVLLDTGTGMSGVLVGCEGYLQIATGTTCNSDGGVISPIDAYHAAKRQQFRGRFILPNSANLTQWVAGFSDCQDFSDPNNLIAFRHAGGACVNIFAVTDSGGSETTTDTAITPDGATEAELEINVSGTGSVTFTYNGTTATHDTNIPTGNLWGVAGGRSNTTSVNIQMRDVSAWQDE